MIMSESRLLEGKKILIVDDETDILEVMEELLAGCILETATTFNEAKELLESQNFDLAILDIMGVDGYKLLDIANERKIPALMLTAHAFTPDNIVRSIKQGAVSYVPKDEIRNIKAFLIDIFKAREEGRNPWESWQDRLPTSYFEKRFGAAWQDADKRFWETFRAGLRNRKKE